MPPPWGIPCVPLDLALPTHTGACWVLCSPQGCAKIQWEVPGESSFPVRPAVFSGMENESCVNPASTGEETHLRGGSVLLASRLPTPRVHRGSQLVVFKPHLPLPPPPRLCILLIVLCGCAVSRLVLQGENSVPS